MVPQRPGQPGRCVRKISSSADAARPKPLILLMTRIAAAPRSPAAGYRYVVMMPDTTRAQDTPVLVAGGGPAGLAAAAELASRGVACVVIEPRVHVSHRRPRA